MRRIVALGSVLLGLAMAGWHLTPTPVAVFAADGVGSPKAAAPALADEQLAFSALGHTDEGRSPRGSLWLWSAGSGRLRQLARGYGVSGFCFSPDGKRIAFLGYRPPQKWPELDLHVLDITTGKVEQVTKGFWGACNSTIAWRPGTEQVAASCARLHRDPGPDDPGDGGLWLIDVKTGQMTRIIASSDTAQPTSTDPRFNWDGTMLASMRIGRYAAVLEVARPDRWFRLDQPSYMNPDWLMDWVWVGKDRKLLLGTTSAERHLFDDDRFSVAEGPGGVWEWDLAHENAVIAPRLSCDDLLDLGVTRARPVCAQGKTVYGLAVSEGEGQVAYASDSGVWVYSLKNESASRVASVTEMPSLGGLREYDEVWGLPSLVRVLWSASGRYLSVQVPNCPGVGDTLRVFDVTEKRVLAPRLSARNPRVFAAWRPMPDAMKR